MANNHKLCTFYFQLRVIDNVAMLPCIEMLPGYETRAAFTVNSVSVFKEDIDRFVDCREGKGLPTR